MSSVVTASAFPPSADTRQSSEALFGANPMELSGPHVAPNPIGASSVLVRTAPGALQIRRVAGALADRSPAFYNEADAMAHLFPDG